MVGDRPLRHTMCNRPQGTAGVCCASETCNLFAGGRGPGRGLLGLLSAGGHNNSSNSLSSVLGEAQNSMCHPYS